MFFQASYGNCGHEGTQEGLIIVDERGALEISNVVVCSRYISTDI